jgi:hypothetical protein
MGHSPSSKAISSSSSQQIPHILCNPNVHHCIHKGQAFVPVFSHINPVHILPSSYFNIHFKITLPSTPWSFKQSLSFRVSYTQALYKSNIIIQSVHKNENRGDTHACAITYLLNGVQSFLRS